MCISRIAIVRGFHMESHMGKACMKKAKVCFCKNSKLIANSLAFVNDRIYAANDLVCAEKAPHALCAFWKLILGIMCKHIAYQLQNEQIDSKMRLQEYSQDRENYLMHFQQSTS